MLITLALLQRSTGELAPYWIPAAGRWAGLPHLAGLGSPTKYSVSFFELFLFLVPLSSGLVASEVEPTCRMLPAAAQQVHILRLLRLLGQHAEGVTDTMSDALAQVRAGTTACGF